MLGGEDGGGGSGLKVEGEALVKYVSAILDVTSGQNDYRWALKSQRHSKNIVISALLGLTQAQLLN